MAQCPGCSGMFPVEALTSRRGGKCRACINAYHREWRGRNKDKHRATVKRYRTSPKGVKKRHERHIRAKFGLSAETFALMMEAQASSCQICERPFSNDNPPCVDHSHETNVVRGLLCRVCNASLGGFRDSVRLLLAAAKYVESHASD